MRGRLIVLEGSEGAGKSTQARRLVEHLASSGRAAIVAREPGGTPLGDRIRNLLLHGGEIAPAAEALLFMASRAELVSQVVRPALENGTIVVMDRFFLSTYAYQIFGRGLPEGRIREANALATGGVVPDLTILLTVAAGARQERTLARGGTDRLEQAGAAFHARVDSAFAEFLSSSWQAAHPECGPVVPVDGTGHEEEVFTRIQGVLAAHLPETFAALHGFQ